MKYLLMLSVLFLMSCGTDPVNTKATNNPDVNVSLLFEHDGCKVFRFWDRTYHYYVVCSKANAQTLSQESCGKNCTRDEEITTKSK